jgi:hypothetical protein
MEQKGRMPDDDRFVHVPPALDDVLRAAARLQARFPDAVLVGGTAAAIHAGHRISLDDDHVLADLRERFDQVLDALEQDDAWGTARVKAPVLILGRLDGVETGVRQLIRRRPLELERVVVRGHRLVVPTLPEMVRIKAWLILRRNATRDYLDTVALAARLGADAPGVLAGLDAYYADQHEAGGHRLGSQLVRQLADPRPYDLDVEELPRYRQIIPELRSWDAVRDRCVDLAAQILEVLI